MSSDTRIVLGEVVGAHGLQGEVRVRVAGDTGENLLAARTLWLTPRDAGAPGRACTVLGRGAGRAGEVRLRFEGIRDRDAAEALKGARVSIEAAALPPLPEGEFYWHELVGCEVESCAGQALGRVQTIWETGAHDVLVIVDDRGARRLVPTAPELMQRVDLAARRIVVADLPGLLDPT